MQSVISDPTYPLFRSAQIEKYSKTIKGIAGPFLNYDASQTIAGQELAHTIMKAWDLSAKMHAAQVSFQNIYPETGGRFTAATMVAKDCPKDGMQLQREQARIKLVICPAITMRDDRGTSITAKAVIHSDVLVML